MRKTKEEYPKVYLYRRVVQAKLFMDEHYGEKIDLNAIASEAYFSRFHFLRIFKEAYHKTPHQYLTFIRIGKAKELMKQKHLSIADICYEVGFESAASFTSLFKKQTGCTPQQYRKFLYEKLDIAKTQPLKLIPGCFAKTKKLSV